MLEPTALISLIDHIAVLVFALTGALVASRKQMDIFGFALLAAVTGLGGGAVRDTALGTLPMVWVQEPSYLLVCAATAFIGFFFVQHINSRYTLILWLDSLGLSFFAVLGADKALGAGVDPVIAIMMGVVTASFGGIIRDILGGEIPLILRREIYVSAALLGAVTYVILVGAGLSGAVSGVAGFAACFVLRALSIRYQLSLPRYKPRAGRTFT